MRFVAVCAYTREVHSWADITLAQAEVAPSLARVIDYRYTPLDPAETANAVLSSWLPRRVEESIEGVVVSRTYYAYYRDSVTGMRVEIVEQDVQAKGRALRITGRRR